MDPLTATLIGLKIFGGLTKASGQRKQYGQIEDASLFNASLYEDQANLIRQSAAQDVSSARRYKKAFLATQKTNYAFRGVKMTGSPLHVMSDTAANLELDIQTTEFNALSKAAYAESQAARERIKARNARLAGKTSTGITLINTAADFINIVK